MRANTPGRQAAVARLLVAVLLVVSAGNTIGGTAPAGRNVVSANSGEGVRIDGAPSTGNFIQGNYIGTDASGTLDRGNGASGVYVRRAPGNSLIGNLVSGNNGFAGVAICGNPGGFCGGNNVGTQGSDAAGNVVQGNFVGTSAEAAGPLGNSQRGVSIDGAPSTVVGGLGAGEANVIAYNGFAAAYPGVVVFGTGAVANAIRGNSIHSNAGLGIDLGADGVTPNDLGDVDTGPNNFQNFPVLDTAASGNGTTTIAGTLNSTANGLFTIDFYASPACDPIGHGEGAVHLGSTTVSTDGSGDATFDATFDTGVQLGHVVTATATDSAGNTSEFSACVTREDPAIIDPDSGLAGGALSFDGVDDFVNVPHHLSLSLTALTIEAWVKIDDGEFTQAPVLSKGPEFGNYSLQVTGDGNVVYVHQTSDGNYSCCASMIPPFIFGQWTHVAATLSGSTVSVYVNGDLVATRTDAPAPLQRDDSLFLGRAVFQSVPDRHLRGLLDEVRIWDLARTPQEIAANYNRTVSNTSAGLVAYWKFDEAADEQTVFDASQFGNHGTLGADAEPGPDDPTRVVSTAPLVQ